MAAVTVGRTAAVATAAAGGAAYWTHLEAKCEAPGLVHGRNVEPIVRATPALHRPYRPTAWCTNAHLQMVVHDFKKKWGHNDVALRRQLLRHADGGITALDWVESTDTTITPTVADCPAAPVVLVLHTITGRAQDCYGMVTLVKALAAEGWRVVIHARRGCGNIALETPRFNILGDVGDTRDAVNAIYAAAPAAPVMMVGLSAGSGIMVRYLGEEAGASAQGVVAAAAICPGYQIPEAFCNVKPLFQRILTSKLQSHFLEGNADVLRAAPAHDAAYAAAMGSKSILEFVDAVHVFAGAESPAHYHATSDPFVVAQHITVPMLALNALDDPVCCAANIRREMFADPDRNLVLATTPHGGHLAFYEGWAAEPWVDRVVTQFLTAALDRATVPLAAGAAAADAERRHRHT